MEDDREIDVMKVFQTLYAGRLVILVFLSVGLFSGLLLVGGATPEGKSTEIKLSNYVDTRYQQMFLIDLKKRVLSKNVFDRWKEMSAVNSDETSGQDRLQWNEILAQDGKSIFDFNHLLKKKTFTIRTTENSKVQDVYNYISYVNALVSKEAKTFFQDIASQPSSQIEAKTFFQDMASQPSSQIIADTVKTWTNKDRFVSHALAGGRSIFFIEVIPSTPSKSTPSKMNSALLVAFSAILGALLGGFFVLLRQALLDHRRLQPD